MRYGIWTSWALRLTSLSSSFLLASLLGLLGYQACLSSVFYRLSSARVRPLKIVARSGLGMCSESLFASPARSAANC